jgi:hypothetical protein
MHDFFLDDVTDSANSAAENPFQALLLLLRLQLLLLWVRVLLLHIEMLRLRRDGVILCSRRLKLQPRCRRFPLRSWCYGRRAKKGRIEQMDGRGSLLVSAG